ncbi:phosphoribosylaminoimidazolecarboxamide formyltransferase [Cohnella faecalis]|uniref:phosphoribosylaminoimidazolecarboxamide formyltransferase n=1 Tax=Cohnella faecalis TaxID=2315694 RepID=UPI00361090CD
MAEIMLRYGINPHQGTAKLYSEKKLPVKILNGEPSYTNILDALNSFQLVMELKKSLGLPSAASFKHVSPAGAAVYNPLSPELARSYFVEDLELSPLAVAYARARGADRMSSFGDCAAFSDTVDISVANMLKREVSDMIVAPGYDAAALEILQKKKHGKYLIIEIDPDYNPPVIERKMLYGLDLQQERNEIVVTEEMLTNIVTDKKAIPDLAKRDLLLAMITLKYTQSNSVCFALEGQAIGIGAGQQSRIHCTRIAGDKADNWFLRQHPLALSMKFKEGVSRTEKNNAIDLWLYNNPSPYEEAHWATYFDETPVRLTPDEKKAWLQGLKQVSYASDALLPFRDNLDRASQSGVKYVVQTGSSSNDVEIVKGANEYGMVMAYSGVRLFHH